MVILRLKTRVDDYLKLIALIEPRFGPKPFGSGTELSTADALVHVVQCAHIAPACFLGKLPSSPSCLLEATGVGGRKGSVEQSISVLYP